MHYSFASLTHSHSHSLTQWVHSTRTQVAAENTALVVLAGWVEEGPQGHRSTTEQLKELLGLVRGLT